MDAHELMLRRSQYICVLALVNARFSILKKKKQKPTKRRTKRFWIREYLKKREGRAPFPYFRETPCLFLIGGLEPNNLGEIVMSETLRQRPRRYKFKFLFVGNGRRPSQKSGTRRENRNAPDSPELSPAHPRRLGISTISSFH